MIPHQKAQYLFDLVSVDLVVSLNGNSPPMEKQREWRVAVFPTPVSGVGCHFINIIIFFFYYKSYTNASRLNHYNFRKLTLFASYFHHFILLVVLRVKVYFGVLHKRSADVTRSDTPWGSKPPQLQVGTFNSHQIRCIG